MLNLSVAGRLGRDAVLRTTQNGDELCSFSVAVDVGFGDRKQTYWVDVTRWGKGAKGLTEILRKGSAVAVNGELTTREHDGKTYLQCRADNVTVLNAPKGERAQEPHPGAHGGDNSPVDLDDEIPF